MKLAGRYSNLVHEVSKRINQCSALKSTDRQGRILKILTERQLCAFLCMHAEQYVRTQTQIQGPPSWSRDGHMIQCAKFAPIFVAQLPSSIHVCNFCFNYESVLSEIPVNLYSYCLQRHKQHVTNGEIFLPYIYI